MAGGSVETTLELWASSLRDVKARIRPLFLQERMAQSAGLFLDALLGPERRKTGWMRAEAAGDPGPWASRPFSAERRGTPTRSGTWCGTMRLRRWLRLMPFWSWTRPGF